MNLPKFHVGRQLGWVVHTVISPCLVQYSGFQPTVQSVSRLPIVYDCVREGLSFHPACPLPYAWSSLSFKCPVILHRIRCGKCSSSPKIACHAFLCLITEKLLISDSTFPQNHHNVRFIHWTNLFSVWTVDQSVQIRYACPFRYSPIIDHLVTVGLTVRNN